MKRVLVPFRKVFRGFGFVSNLGNQPAGQASLVVGRSSSESEDAPSADDESALREYLPVQPP